MIKRTVMAVLLAAFTVTAMANGNENGHNNGKGHHKSSGGGNQGQQQGQLQGQLQGQKQNSSSNSYAGSSTSNSNNYLNDNSDTYEEYVASAFAPALAVANGTCMGSMSAGGSNSVMGFSLGGTYVSDACNTRFDATMLHNMGFKDAALTRMCMEPSLSQALGSKCPKKDPKRVVQVGRWWTE